MPTSTYVLHTAAGDVIAGGNTGEEAMLCALQTALEAWPWCDWIVSDGASDSPWGEGATPIEALESALEGIRAMWPEDADSDPPAHWRDVLSLDGYTLAPRS